MSEKKCCVPKCNVTQLDGIVLHCFPNPKKDADRFRMWIYGIGGDILSLDNQYIYKCRRVCHKHFDLKYLTWTKRLSPNAIPTLHLPGNDIVYIQSPSDISERPKCSQISEHVSIVEALETCSDICEHFGRSDISDGDCTYIRNCHCCLLLYRETFVA